MGHGDPLLRRAVRRIAAHRGEAVVVGACMIVVALAAGVTGLSAWVGRVASASAVAGALLVAFATVWAPIAVIDFRRCTRETALRTKVEADLERQAATLLAQQREAATITERVEAVLAAGGPRIAFQPIVDLADLSVVGYEALSRFEDGTPPDAWFAAAAKVGLATDAELAAVAVALTQLPRIPDLAYLSVNVSPSALRDPRLLDLIATNTPAGRVVVEVTEHLALDDYDTYRSVVDELHESGVRIAVDDAGSGYASFRHILDLGPDIIKLDRSLVHRVHLDAARRSLLTAFVGFASDIGATLIAEGVEELEEQQTLRQWDVPFAQGWLYGKPCELPSQHLVRPTSR